MPIYKLLFFRVKVAKPRKVVRLSLVIVITMLKLPIGFDVFIFALNVFVVQCAVIHHVNIYSRILTIEKNSNIGIFISGNCQVYIDVKANYTLKKTVQDYLEQEVADVSDLIIAEKILTNATLDAYRIDKGSDVYKILDFVSEIVSQARYQKGNSIVERFFHPNRDEVVHEATV